ncbi:hypothetical protein VPH526E571_0019 [Vibrio phage 526E57-1]
MSQTERRPYRGETASRRILNGTERMSSTRIAQINTERTLSLSADEAQGRLRVQAENDSITLWS